MSEIARALVDSLLRIDVIAALDILLLAVVIYQMWRTLEGTRGRQLTRGVAVLVLVFLLSRPFPVLHSLLRTAMEPAVIALVILFQPELRAALTRIGGIRPLRTALGMEELHVLFEAIDHFSTNRIGALIAIEGSTGLSDIAATGTILDSELTQELLSSVFFPNSALHDGGVILRQGRVLAAACYFPPTTNPAAPRTLGMRHRAALGLTEHSDAVVLVVSEETGAVSIATAGEIHRNLKRAEFREKIRELYRVGSAPAFSLSFRRRRS